ncbi:MAG: hypothetical protein HOV66_13535 [Streptomycetaceae bacterium]|nr:hypothetical protein [Streptomycetaceae bacterium]
MLTLGAGANTPVPMGTFETTVTWDACPGSPAVDVCALLLGPDGKVRSDADFVFYNQPTDAHGAVRCLAATSDAPGLARIRVALGTVPEDVDRILVAASTDGRAFTEVTGLRTEVTAFAATVTATATAASDFAATCAVTGTGPETVLILAEFYRRGPVWKIRAVGQGYASGLAGLAEDYGVTVDDDGSGGSGPTAVRPTTPQEATSAAIPLRPLAPPPPRPPLPPLPALPPRPTSSPPIPGSTPGGLPPAADTSRLSDRALAQRMEHRKRDAASAMTACGLSGHRARIVIAMDASPEMTDITRPSQARRSGLTLQQHMENHVAITALIERLAAVAACAADDAEAEVWAYVNRHTRMRRKLSVDELPYWRKTDRLRSLRHGFTPDQPRIAHELAATYDAPAGSRPTLVLFFTASDITTPAPLTRTFTETAALPLFWQFIGLGPTPFTTLEQTVRALPPRPADNCDFFALDTPGRITDQVLFPELFAAYARWLRSATAAGIARF